MIPVIHTYTSTEPMLQVNAFIVEAEKAVVIVDTTLTMSDSQALKKKAHQLGKPLAGILLTHGHPDHVAGTYTIAPQGEVPIYALSSVKKLMEETEQTKHEQWSALFGAEWIPRWVYPNRIVSDRETVNLAGLQFQVLDLGSGGDSDANAIWLLDGENPVAFVGDFIYNRNHTYMADGSILRWLANLERFGETLKQYRRFYIGHGEDCEYAALNNQKKYLLHYLGELLKVTSGTAGFTQESKQQFETSMLAQFPDFGCQFMVGLAAEKVSSELKSLTR
jgi:glyoxylase-like metal-dependent hydrolase (beta-lactamase superfamily II)